MRPCLRGVLPPRSEIGPAAQLHLETEVPERFADLGVDAVPAGVVTVSVPVVAFAGTVVEHEVDAYLKTVAGGL